MFLPAWDFLGLFFSGINVGFIVSRNPKIFDGHFLILITTSTEIRASKYRIRI